MLNRYEMANRVHDLLGYVPVTYVVANPSSYAWPDSTRPTDAAFSIQAHAPGYIPEIASGAAAFRSFGGARDCTTYDRWPYGLQGRTGYAAKETDEQLKKQLSSLQPLTCLASSMCFRSAASMARARRWRRGHAAGAREAFGKFVNEKLGAHHVVKIVPECGHNARCMFTSEDALPLLFPKPAQ